MLLVCPMLRCKYFRDDMLSFTLMFPRVITLRGERTATPVHTDAGVLFAGALWWAERNQSVTAASS